MCLTKLLRLIILSGFTVSSCSAAVTYTFVNKSGLYDGNTSVIDSIVDVTSTQMTVSANTSTLNSNMDTFGINDSSIDGLTEIITISFDKDVIINIMDFSAIGADAMDGGSVTIGLLAPVTLFTGQPNFNGTTDTYTPATPITLLSGQSITITGSTGSSDFSLSSINLTVVPEPSSSSLLAVSALLLFKRKRK